MNHHRGWVEAGRSRVWRTDAILGPPRKCGAGICGPSTKVLAGGARVEKRERSLVGKVLNPKLSAPGSFRPLRKLRGTTHSRKIITHSETLVRSAAVADMLVWSDTVERCKVDRFARTGRLVNSPTDGRKCCFSLATGRSGFDAVCRPALILTPRSICRALPTLLSAMWREDKGLAF